MSTSQFGQDVHLIQNIYKNKKNGYFVEVGAYDGINMSNTHFLEKEFNWDGICIECNPCWFNKLQKNRPNAINYDYAVYNQDNLNLDFIDDDTGGCSGFVETNTHTHILHKNIINVTTKKLTTILDMANAPNFIEFLSLDTEGSEYEILKCHDFDKYLFGYICVEHNFIDVNRKKIRELLESKGYIFYRQNNVDDDYIHKTLLKKMRGVFYNSKKSLCSIWESGKICYDILNSSKLFTIDYSEDTNFDYSYDFIVVNEHFIVNNWITQNMILRYNKPSFCIVTEVGLGADPIMRSPNFFTNYIVLDPTINETSKIHAFCRPLDNFDNLTDISLNRNTDTDTDTEIPIIGSFGFATNGKEWNKIIECVHNEFDNAIINFNIPKATYVPSWMHDSQINNILNYITNNVTKPGIKVNLTHDNLSKEELILFCKKSTINCFFYYRQHMPNIGIAGLAAVTDQAIVSGKPLLVTHDQTFRHIHKYIDYYPTISIKQAIKKTVDGVNKMKNDWACSNFLIKFEKILCNYIPN